MTEIAEQILSSALALDDRERAEVAARLIDTLDPARDVDYVPAWEAEIRSRLGGLNDGTVAPIPWDQARGMIRKGGANESQAG